MRHLKRFKNWLVVAYYACWQYAQQLQTAGERNEQSESIEQPSMAAADSELQTTNESTAANDSQVEAVKVIEAPAVEKVVAAPPVVEVKKPEQKATPSPQAPAKPQASSTPAVKVQAPQPPAVKVQASQIPAKPKSNGGPARAPEPQSQPGKYQPGAINDQTAQRLARLLVSEIKLYYKSKSEGDTTIDTANIYDLLREPIEKSRQHYNQRMGKTAIESMPDYFHGELVRTLCGGDASRLGPNYPG
jgi:outer membrane biosynthesis protein TonB